MLPTVSILLALLTKKGIVITWCTESHCVTIRSRMKIFGFIRGAKRLCTLPLQSKLHRVIEIPLTDEQTSSEVLQEG
jgi:hypothetical protein